MVAPAEYLGGCCHVSTGTEEKREEEMQFRITPEDDAWSTLIEYRTVIDAQLHVRRNFRNPETLTLSLVKLSPGDDLKPDDHLELAVALYGGQCEMTVPWVTFPSMLAAVTWADVLHITDRVKLIRQDGYGYLSDRVLVLYEA